MAVSDVRAQLQRLLVKKWVRLGAFPILAGAPAAALAAWYKFQKGQEDEAVALFLAGVWAGGLSMARALLTETSEAAVRRLQADRDEAWSLIGAVRSVVTKKSRRFHEDSIRLGGTPTSAQIFETITQPNQQIRTIANAMYFFYRDTGAQGEDVRVSIMRWDAQVGHLVWVDYCPDGEHPRTPVEYFKGRTTAASRAYETRELQIVEDIASDRGYFRADESCEQREGSCVSYPVRDDVTDEVVLVVNVVSSRPQRFLRKNAKIVRLALDVFGDRLLLETRLERLKSRAA